jgi:hypothetical protein
MRMRVIELEKDDRVMVFHNIGNISPDQVDEYSSKCIEPLKHVFGTDKVALIPVREGEDWDFIIIRK